MSQDDIAKGRLVVPFKITLPADAGFYLVSPRGQGGFAEACGVPQWLVASVAKSEARRRAATRDANTGRSRTRGRLVISLQTI